MPLRVNAPRHTDYARILRNVFTQLLFPGEGLLIWHDIPDEDAAAAAQQANRLRTYRHAPGSERSSHGEDRQDTRAQDAFACFGKAARDHRWGIMRGGEEGRQTYPASRAGRIRQWGS